MNIIYPEKQILSQLASEDFEMESKWEGTPLSIWFPKFHTENGNGIGNGIGIQDLVHWFCEMELNMEMELDLDD